MKGVVERSETVGNITVCVVATNNLTNGEIQRAGNNASEKLYHNVGMQELRQRPHSLLGW